MNKSAILSDDRFLSKPLLWIPVNTNPAHHIQTATQHQIIFIPGAIEEALNFKRTGSGIAENNHGFIGG